MNFPLTFAPTVSVGVAVQTAVAVSIGGQATALNGLLQGH